MYEGRGSLTFNDVPGNLMSAVVAGFLAVVIRDRGRPLTLALALSGGLLLSYHAYSQDCMLLLAALGLVGQTEGAVGFRRMLQVSLMPLPYALLPAQNGWSSVLTLLIIGAFAAGARLALVRESTTHRA